MKSSNIKGFLFLSILVMTIVPMLSAFYFLDRALQTSLDLGFNAQIIQALENSSRNLRALKDRDPEKEVIYREQFQHNEELRQVYANPELVKRSIQSSLTIYFGVGLIAAIALSILLAAILSRSISRAYRSAYDELTRQRERVRYLEEMSSWQELAKMLAHEIKNPLTPIEVLVTSLSKAYLAKPEGEFQAQLRETQSMINEELTHLKNTVNKFSEFAKLPAVRLIDEDLSELLAQQVKAVSALFEGASIRIESPAAVRAKLDATLFRQVLTNIVRNATEANPGRTIQITIAVTMQPETIEIAIANDGEPVPVALVGRLFDPYVSGKSGKDNMGLGLAIVRKVIIEHAGDIAYAQIGNRPTFTISLPKLI